MDPEDCRDFSGALFSAGTGAAIANVAAIAGATVTWPIAVVAIPVAWYGYDKSEWWKSECDTMAGMTSEEIHQYYLAKSEYKTVQLLPDLAL
jgi:TM2 domain-containing membrane protein YozV